MFKPYEYSFDTWENMELRKPSNFKGYSILQITDIFSMLGGNLMSLVNLNQVLDLAKKEKFAVGAFNCLNIEMVKAIVFAAEEERSPVILQMSELLTPYSPDWEATSLVMLKIAREAKVPVVVHFDHGVTFDNVIKAIFLGYSSVMFDGSVLSFNENVQYTNEIVKVAHKLGVSVEAELGHVSGGEGVPDTFGEVLTDVETAEKFVSMTNVDALAICIGNLHGQYRGLPCLDFDRLSNIKRVTKTPLVLHGGSGLTDDDFRKCIQLGITKVNIYTDLCLAIVEKLYSAIDINVKKIHYQDVISMTLDAVKEEVVKKIRLFGSNNRI